jgi:signal peptidase
VAGTRARPAGLSVPGVVERVRVLGLATCAYSLIWLFVAVAVLSLAGLRAVVIDGGSMTPAIRQGDVVLLGDAPRDAGEVLARGTVITFLSPARGDGSLLTHRILDVDAAGRYVTGGDANEVRDSDPVHSASIVGVGRVVVPLVGLPMLWLSQGAYLELAIWLALTALVLWSLFGGSGTPRRGYPLPHVRNRGLRREPAGR